jgi:hypothetical protein
MLWEKMEMVTPSIFLFKTNGLSHHPTHVGVILRHLCNFFFPKTNRGNLEILTLLS